MEDEKICEFVGFCPQNSTTTTTAKTEEMKKKWRSDQKRNSKIAKKFEKIMMKKKFKQKYFPENVHKFNRNPQREVKKEAGIRYILQLTDP